MKYTFAIILSATLLAPAVSWAERKPHTMGHDARVRHVTFHHTDVIRVDTNLRTNTAIELGAGERISQVLLGDSEAYDVNVLSNRNTVSIKPVIGNAASNMTIYTNRRAIAFALTEGSSRTPTFRVVVNFPDDQPARPKQNVGPRDSGYAYSGVGSIKPLAVWNDGRATYFEFRPGVRPSVFAVGPDGYERSVNSGTRGNVVRVSGVHANFTVRIGEETICLRRIEGGTITNPTTIATLAGKEF